MKKVFITYTLLYIAQITTLIIFFPLLAKAQTKTLYLGQILIQTEYNNALWYIHPKTGQRFFLYNPERTMEVIRKVGLGIHNKNLEKIPKTNKDKKDARIFNKFRGNIVLQVESKGQAWYINPKDNLRYYLPSGKSALNILKTLGKEIKNKDLKKIPMNTLQKIFDPMFQEYAHVNYSQQKFSQSYYSEQILPLASLTKLMTALVILDQNPDWEKIITIEEKDILYPKIYTEPEDITSEIDLLVGDRVSLQDLWNAMLSASSNQAAAVLSENVGLSQKDFVKKMNEKANAMGLKKTHFTESSGLDPLNIGTAKEMVKIAHEAFKNEKILVSTQKSFTFQVKGSNGTSRTIQANNRNESILKLGAEAAKVGFLTEAQRNVAMKKGNVVSVILHARSLKEKNSLIKKLLGY